MLRAYCLINTEKPCQGYNNHHNRHHKANQKQPELCKRKGFSAMLYFLHQQGRSPLPANIIAHKDSAQRKENIICQHTHKIKNVVV